MYSLYRLKNRTLLKRCVPSRSHPSSLPHRDNRYFKHVCIILFLKDIVSYKMRQYPHIKESLVFIVFKLNINAVWLCVFYYDFILSGNIVDTVYSHWCRVAIVHSFPKLNPNISQFIIHSPFTEHLVCFQILLL